jgi:hypothetical protein
VRIRIKVKEDIAPLHKELWSFLLQNISRDPAIDEALSEVRGEEADLILQPEVNAETARRLALKLEKITEIESARVVTPRR